MNPAPRNSRPAYLGGAWCGVNAAVLASAILVFFFSALSWSHADDFKERQAKINEYKQWLESVGSGGSRLWLRLDDSRRPHRLYLGETFHAVDHKFQEQFVEIFSHYLAGHPEKFMLVDLFDGETGTPVGEFGWGGFKLYTSPRQWPEN
jgi:hypothetical protein